VITADSQLAPAAVSVVREVARELTDALDRFGSFTSPHEGWAVIREELDELWSHVIANTGRSPEARQEAIQVAAMGLRYAMDLTARESEEQ
jgi:hypothetical protein